MTMDHTFELSESKTMVVSDRSRKLLRLITSEVDGVDYVNIGILVGTPSNLKIQRDALLEALTLLYPGNVAYQFAVEEDDDEVV